jgi:hypothetical protein
MKFFIVFVATLVVAITQAAQVREAYDDQQHTLPECE